MQSRNSARSRTAVTCTVLNPGETLNESALRSKITVHSSPRPSNSSTGSPAICTPARALPHPAYCASVTHRDARRRHRHRKAFERLRHSDRKCPRRSPIRTHDEHMMKRQAAELFEQRNIARQQAGDLVDSRRTIHPTRSARHSPGCRIQSRCADEAIRSSRHRRTRPRNRIPRSAPPSGRERSRLQ